MSIYLNNRDNTSKCARYKTLVSFIYILGMVILLENGNMILLVQLSDFLPCHPIPSIVSRGSANRHVFNHEKMYGI